jgi:hypothetical protein
MRIREEIAKRYWHEAAIDELVDKYATQGYDVQKDGQIGNYPADLVLKRGNELVVIEVKSGDWNPEKTRQVQKIRNEVVHQLGGKFNLVLVSPPQEKSIEIEGIEDALLEAFATNRGELDKLSPHTTIETISDVIMTAVSVEKNRVHAKGSGVVSVELNWEADTEKDEVVSSSDSYPFEFEILLDENLKIVEIVTLTIDISSFYE